MKNKLRILTIFILCATTLIGGVVGFFGQSYLSQKSQQPLNPLEITAYYLRDGFLYKTTSSNSTEEKVIDTQILVEPNLWMDIPYVVAGSNHNHIFYMKQIKLKSELGWVRNTEIHHYDVDAKKDSIFETGDEKNNFQNLVVSPNGKRIAYLFTHESKNDSDQAIHTLVLYNIDTQSKKTIEESKPLSFIPQAYAGGGPGLLFVKRWMNDDTLLIGSGYEGAQYCAFQVDKETSLSTDCTLVGSEYFESNYPSYITNDSYLGKSTYSGPDDMTQPSSQDRGIYKQRLDGKTKQFLNHDNNVTEYVLGKDVVYYLSSQTTSSFGYATLKDIFSVDLNGTSITRKTFDGGSIQVKKDLHISPDGRFLSYHSYLTSEVDEQKPETLWNNVSVWVYDTVLNKQYKVADRAMFPSVIMQ